MSGHTPGPWWVTDSGVRDSGGLICSSIKAFHYPGQYERFEREVAERLSNARLISAAPDLLEALQAIVESITGVDQISCVNEARAAIAKATGATP